MWLTHVNEQNRTILDLNHHLANQTKMKVCHDTKKSPMTYFNSENRTHNKPLPSQIKKKKLTSLAPFEKIKS
jgi:hypothetical protein